MLWRESLPSFFFLPAVCLSSSSTTKTPPFRLVQFCSTATQIDQKCRRMGYNGPKTAGVTLHPACILGMAIIPLDSPAMTAKLCWSSCAQEGQPPTRRAAAPNTSLLLLLLLLLLGCRHDHLQQHPAHVRRRCARPPAATYFPFLSLALSCLVFEIFCSSRSQREENRGEGWTREEGSGASDAAAARQTAWVAGTGPGEYSGAAPIDRRRASTQRGKKSKFTAYLAGLYGSFPSGDL